MTGGVPEYAVPESESGYLLGMRYTVLLLSLIHIWPIVITAVQFYAHAQSFKDAYAAAMRPLCQRLELSQTAMDILLFLANNPSKMCIRDSAWFIPPTKV